MSARSMSRARERELSREQRRWGRRAKRASAGAAAALGAGIAFAPAADAATFTVNSNDDAAATACDATCTLRDAIGAANADAAPDTITFAPSVTGQIRLDDGEGALLVDSSMAITGPGSGALAIDGSDGGGTQLFYVDTNVVGAPFEAVTITGLTLREGDTGGAGSAIYAYESATSLDAVEVRANDAGDDGAVYMQGGSLNVSNSTFADNDSASDGGAIYTDDDNGPDTGGTSRVVITNSTFVGNSTPGAGGAIYIDDETDSALITGTTISGNFAEENGGGLVIFGVETGAARIENSTITGNSTAGDGAGVYIYNQYDRPVEFVNSTIAANAAGNTGGAIYNYAADLPAYAGNDDVTLSSTIVSGNSPPELVNRVFDLGEDPVVGTFLTGFSLIGSTAGAPITETPAGSNKLNVDPLLGPLANNGGPTSTLLPAETSPVVDSGIANGLTVDQRGLPRTVKRTFTPAAGSDGTDIGAVELQDTALNGVTVTAKKKQKVKGKKIVVVVQVGAAEPIQVTGSGSLKAGKKAKAKLKPVTKTLAAGASTKLKLKPKSKKSSKKVLKALKDGKKAKAKISIVATDPAGNSQTSKPKVTLTAKKKKG